MKTKVSNFTGLVLNQSPISAVPLIVRCPRDQKTALMGDSLYLGLVLTLLKIRHDLVGMTPFCQLDLYFVTIYFVYI